MNQAITKFNRAGASHDSRTLRPLTVGYYGFSRLSTATREIFDAINSYTQKGRSAQFTYADFAARYNISPATVARGIRLALDEQSRLFKRGSTLHTYLRREEFRAVPERYFYRQDWLHFAPFESGDHLVTLARIDAEILSYIIHQLTHIEGWTSSFTSIAADLGIATSTVSLSIRRLEGLKLYGAPLLTLSLSAAGYTEKTAPSSLRAVNHHVKVHYSLDFELLAKLRKEVTAKRKRAGKEVQIADYRTGRDRFYADQQRKAYARADAIRTALGRDYQELEDELRSLTNKAKLAQVQRHRDLFTAIMKRRTEIQAAIRKKLELAGFCEDDLKPRFACPLCEDTGWRLSDRRACTCYPPPNGNA